MKTLDQADLHFPLRDDDSEFISNEPITAQVICGVRGLEIGFTGYGDASTVPGYGAPIYIEVHQGRLMLHVWADINQEDPTHVIDLEGARESARKEK